MEAYQNNMQNLTDYIDLIAQMNAGRENLTGEPPEELRQSMQKKMEQIFQKEKETPIDIFLTLPYLREVFGLDFPSFFLVAVALVFEMDGGFRFNYQNKWRKAFPDFNDGFLLLELLQPLGDSIFSIALSKSSLTLCLLSTEREAGCILERPLRLVREAVGFLTCGEPEVHSSYRLYRAGAEAIFPFHREVAEKLSSFLFIETVKLIFLRGRKGAGKKSLIKEIINQKGECILFVSLKRLGAPGTVDFADAVRGVITVAVLHTSSICITDGTNKQIETLNTLLELVRPFSISVLVLCEERLAEVREDGFLSAEFLLDDFPEEKESVLAWMEFAHAAGGNNYLPEEMAARYRYTIGAISGVTKHAALQAGLAGRTADASDIATAVREQNQTAERNFVWDEKVTMEDLIVSDEVKLQLTRICGLMKHQNKLVEEWGFRPRNSRRGSVAALFFGESGTGKTMAASVIAQELGMPLLRADLSQVMDKYIGETEKHLGRMFDSAQENNCVLLFDEADALFGKRTNVESSHDKYANVSTSYLLQRLEQYEGVILLTTNVIHNFDEAFLRRIQYMVKFSMPDQTLRELLWQQAFPVIQRVAPEVDFSCLAQAELSPARIKEAARAAAVLALCEGADTVDMRRIIQAIKLEQEKNGKLLPRLLQDYL